jgi:hypothetical protein
MVAVKAWEWEMEKAKAGGIPRKAWPKKPRCPLKKEVIAQLSESQIAQHFMGDDGEWIDIESRQLDDETDEEETEMA